MSKTRRISAKAISVLAGTAVISAVLTPAAFAAETPPPAATPAATNLTEIPQSSMQALWVNSTPATNEAPNGGPLNYILDGRTETYWHTQWYPSVIAPPHSYIVKLNNTPVKLAKLELTPRQSSNGSGRARAWKVSVTTETNCSENSSYQEVKTGEFPGDTSEWNIVRNIEINPSVPATCVKFTQESSWGGHNPGDTTSIPDRVASLAEFRAFTGEWGTAQPTPAPGLDPITKIPQSQLRSTWESTAAETAGEAAPNGPIANIFDGNRDTYWHTQWHPRPIAPPHSYTVQLGDSPVKLAKIVLTPRQSSNGSGRAHEWELYVSTDGTCTANSNFEKVTDGSFPGDTATWNQDREIQIKPARTTNCVKFVQTSSWGGHQGNEEISLTENVASLAEFNAYTGDWPADSPVPAPPSVDEASLLTLTDGILNVKMFKAFPQVYEWALGEAKAPGLTEAPLPLVTIDEQPKAVTVTEAVVATDQRSATWNFAVTGTPITFKAKVTLDSGVWKFELTDLVDPNEEVHRITLPGLSLVSLEPAEQLATARLSVNRAQSGDQIKRASQYSRAVYSYMSVPTSAQLSFGMDNNAIADNTARYQGSNQGSNAKWLNVFKDGKGHVIPGSFVWRSVSASTIGLDANPYIVVKPTTDANDDANLNWQDGAIALRDIRPAINGSDQVKNTVITRIPFNIVSQATHPFLRTLDDTKRVSLATDGLRQQVMLKGYQAEGHDSAHPDYAGHYNERAGGFSDLVTLANESSKWNATLGVHVNVTESYSESKNFSEDLLQMPPRKAWGWMNQSYYINSPKDLGTGKVLERFQQFKDEAPANLNWLYIDVYYPDGWEGRRLGAELSKQGWVIGSEWANKFPENSIWSHWANDENYGGTENKGISSQIFRFVENSRKDLFNPHPILSNSNIVEFEGWTGHVDYRQFIKNVWDRNLPVKFLQQSDIMKWDANKIVFKNGTVATSSVRSIDGTHVPYNRTISFDGAVVYEGGKYLLPWKDGGKDRLYHWNIEGGSSTWTLTDAWKSQASLEVFKLTDTGRVKVGTVPVENGQVTLNADVNVAYVLYPTSAVPKVKDPNWGQGSNLVDPGFFSGTLDAYQVEGNARVVKSTIENFQAELGDGPSAISQSFAKGNLPAGTYNASAWVEIQPGENREVSLSVSGSGVKPTKLQAAVDGVPTTKFRMSLTPNKTASDEKLNTFFQRARVTFTTTGGRVDFKISAAAGTAKVLVDDLRIVPFVEPVLPAGVDASKVVLFENYENPDAGYWPYVTGPDQRGDARTQLTELHPPYSQAGWWGVNASGTPQAGFKLVDNVLDGKWSIMAHEENLGVILQTSETTVQFKENHKYRISFDYQNALSDTYAFVTGYSTVRDNRLVVHKDQVHSFKSTADISSLPARGTTQKFEHVFNVGACGSYWFGIEKLSGGHQADLSMDNILVEDLGVSDQPPACAQITAEAQDASLVAGKTNLVNTIVTSDEKQSAQVLKHSLGVPEGWSVVALDLADPNLPAQGTSTQRWLVTTPADSAGMIADLNVAAAYDLGDQGVRVLQKTVPMKVNADGLVNGKNYLSDLPFVSSSNGWGPVERDTNNGENQAGDGGPIRIDGVTYEKGLGTHANSVVRFDLGGKCTSFRAVVGVDDRQATAGSVQFTVSGDDRVLVPLTPVMRANSPAKVLEADLTGVDVLILRVTNGGDGAGNDWASWGDAHINCAVAPKEAPATLTVSADSAKPGEEIILSLTGFQPAGSVSIRNAFTAEEFGTAEVSAEGNATFKYVVPADAKPAELTFGAVQAVDADWKAASAKIQVTAKTEDVNPSGPGTGSEGGEETPAASAEVTLLTTEITAGDEIVGIGKGFAANTEYLVELHSKPLPLGLVTSDAAGKITFSFKTPATVSAGAHHVVILDKAGKQLTKSAIVVKAKSAGSKPVVKPSKPGSATKPAVSTQKASVKTLSNTGASVAGFTVVALVLGAAGVMLIRRRQG